MAQISVSVKPNTIEVLKEIATEQDKSFSATVNGILTSYAAQWIVKKPVKSKTKSTNKK